MDHNGMRRRTGPSPRGKLKDLPGGLDRAIEQHTHLGDQLIGPHRPLHSGRRIWMNWP